jgi:hypothetical protein
VNRRPRLELRGSAESPEEAAAVMVAIEQFLREAVGLADDEPPTWGDPTPWAPGGG